MSPSSFELFPIFSDEQKCLEYLIEKNVFYHSLKCLKCGQDMQIDYKRNMFRCPIGKCRGEYSIRKYTFFYGSKLPCSRILYLAHLWINKVSSSSAIGMTNFSSKTVTSFYNHFRKLVSSNLDEIDTIIGGENIIVEIDETKLGKRKYNRGHRVEGVWVLVGVERTLERKVFVVKINQRNSETLNEIISQKVLPGSIIHTDLWKGYSSLNSKLGFAHQCVNHSKTFKDPNTGVHTNTVEGTNNGLKICISPRNRVEFDIEDHLAVFVWRRKNKNKEWNTFIECLKETHYDFQINS